MNNWVGRGKHGFICTLLGNSDILSFDGYAHQAYADSELVGRIDLFSELRVTYTVHGCPGLSHWYILRHHILR
jgi:hypothetical protein